VTLRAGPYLTVVLPLSTTQQQPGNDAMTTASTPRASAVGRCDSDDDVDAAERNRTNRRFMHSRIPGFCGVLCHNRDFCCHDLLIGWEAGKSLSWLRPPNTEGFIHGTTLENLLPSGMRWERYSFDESKCNTCRYFQPP
jgi:hypothetical protein